MSTIIQITQLANYSDQHVHRFWPGEMVFKLPIKQSLPYCKLPYFFTHWEKSYDVRSRLPNLGGWWLRRDVWQDHILCSCSWCSKNTRSRSNTSWTESSRSFSVYLQVFLYTTVLFFTGLIVLISVFKFLRFSFFFFLQRFVFPLWWKFYAT